MTKDSVRLRPLELITRYEKRKAKGLCGRCGRPRDRKTVHCSVCAAKQAKRSKERRDYRKANGLCVRCGKPAEEGEQRCSDCLSRSTTHLTLTEVSPAMKEHFGADDGYLLKAEDNRKAIKAALEQGRVTGKHRCTVCGMLHWTYLDAKDCCTPLDFPEEPNE